MTRLTLVGTDGHVWDLLNRSSPVQLVGGLGGLHLASGTSRWTTTSRRSGRTWRGATSDYRKFSMQVRVADVDLPWRTGDDWRDLDASFWAGLRQDASSALVFNDGRTLTFRLDDDNEMDFPTDPARLGKAIYTIACVADRPEWVGDPLAATFAYSADPGTNYYGATLTTQGPPFNISAPPLSGTKYVDNPGDVPAYPTWTVTGPFSSASLTLGSATISIPFSRSAGQQVIIDSERATITDANGATLWPQMGSAAVDLSPIPPGHQPVGITVNDASDGSAVVVALTPLYRRAW